MKMRHSIKNTIHGAVLLSMLVMLAACGGDGGGNPPPIRPRSAWGRRLARRRRLPWQFL